MSTTHRMHLTPKYFQKIMDGEKTVEFRLYDDKRKAVQVGDAIVFTDTERGHEKFTVVRAIVIGKLPWIIKTMDFIANKPGVLLPIDLKQEMARIYEVNLCAPIEQQPLFVAFVLEV